MTNCDSLHAEAVVLLHTVQCAVHTGEERAPATENSDRLPDYSIATFTSLSGWGRCRWPWWWKHRMPDTNVFLTINHLSVK